MTDPRISTLFRAISVILAAQLREKDPALADWFALDSREANTDDWAQALTKAEGALVGFRIADNPITQPQARPTAD